MPEYSSERSTKFDRKFLVFVGKYWALIFLILETIIFSYLAPGFLTLRGIQIIFFFGTAIFLLGTAETFVIITGGIDLTPQTVQGLKDRYVTVTLDQQLYLQGFLPVLQAVLSKKYGFAGLYINTGAGVQTPETIEKIIPLIDKGIR